MSLNNNVLNPQAILTNSYFATLAGRVEFYQDILDYQPKYNLINKLSSMMSPSKQKGSYLVHMEGMYNTWVTAIIATRTAVGSTLSLTWSDPTEQRLRVGNDIVSQNGAIGRVYSTTPGQAVITFVQSGVAGGTAWVAADFAAAEMVSDRGPVSSIINGNTIERLITVPVDRTNYIMVLPESLTMYEYELSRAFNVPINGTPYYGFSEERQMQMRMAKNVELRTFDSIKSLTGSDLPRTGGIKWQIQEGGTYNLMSSTVQPANIQNMLETIKVLGGGGGSEYIVPAGAEFISNFQRDVTAAFIPYAGQENTVGGKEVVGLNALVYGFNGCTLKLVDYDLFNDSQVFPFQSTISGMKNRQANAALFLNTSMCDTIEGGKVPFIESFHYGNAPVNYNVVPGLIGGNNNSGSQGAPMIGTSGSPSVTYNMSYKICNMLTNELRHGLLEAAA